MERSFSTRAWALLIFGATVAEFRALHYKRNESTLSHATRSVFRTHCKLGKAAFLAWWIPFTIWFVFHVFKEAVSGDTPGSG